MVIKYSRIVRPIAGPNPCSATSSPSSTEIEERSGDLATWPLLRASLRRLGVAASVLSDPLSKVCVLLDLLHMFLLVGTPLVGVLSHWTPTRGVPTESWGVPTTYARGLFHACCHGVE